MPARTTTVPRSNGPASARTAMANPNGAPPYGPVRNTGPESANGADPAPAATDAVPTRLASGQAAASSQRVRFSTPSRPGGCCRVRPASGWSPSARVTASANGVNAPAFRFWTPAWTAGVNGVPPQLPPWPSMSTVNELERLAAGCPEYGVTELVVVAGPHARGVASTAPGPPANARTKSVNGNCGAPANVVVSCPVWASAATRPTRRSDTPDPSATTNRR